jgi:hypothetical protein
MSRVKKAFERLVRVVDHRVGWDKLPVPLGLLALVGVRDTLRDENLFDNNDGTPLAPPAPNARHLVARTVDGSYNDLSIASMGMAKTRFGRNVSHSVAAPEEPPRLYTPNPRTVSTDLLLRGEFKPAPTLNVLAAAWLQFETRDWFSHGTDPANPILVPRPDGDDWPEDPMSWPSTPADTTPSTKPGRRTFLNTETHWWDASQVYGSTQEFQNAIRTEDGKVRIDPNGLIDVDATVLGSSGGADGWWVGMELMHTIFMREHNAIVDRLRAAYPSWSADELFDTARLINAALIAKIHTVEWTTAILGHPTMQIGMRANWWGLAQQKVHDIAGRISKLDLVSGIPGSATDHHSAPYAMTEDFVSVYRMHPLVPDDYVLRDLGGGPSTHVEFMDLHLLKSRPAIERVGVANMLFSLGVANPGALTLHNSPRFMHRIERTDGVFIDLLALDILRSRERGVPRYNEFRRQLHKTPVTSWDQFGPDAESREQLRDIYGGDLEQVDLTVGMFAEPTPRGFGFSDTAFRIFVLMASRRLKSDRFFTVDFTPRVYTPEGMQWIDHNDMRTVLTRHYPVLAPTLRGVNNAFAPWPSSQG